MPLLTAATAVVAAALVGTAVAACHAPQAASLYGGPPPQADTDDAAYPDYQVDPDRGRNVYGGPPGPDRSSDDDAGGGGNDTWSGDGGGTRR